MGLCSVYFRFSFALFIAVFLNGLLSFVVFSLCNRCYLQWSRSNQPTRKSLRQKEFDVRDIVARSGKWMNCEIERFEAAFVELSCRDGFAPTGSFASRSHCSLFESAHRFKYRKSGIQWLALQVQTRTPAQVKSRIQKLILRSGKKPVKKASGSHSPSLPSRSVQSSKNPVRPLKRRKLMQPDVEGKTADFIGSHVVEGTVDVGVDWPMGVVDLSPNVKEIESAMMTLIPRPEFECVYLPNLLPPNFSSNPMIFAIPTSSCFAGLSSMRPEQYFNFDILKCE